MKYVSNECPLSEVSQLRLSTIQLLAESEQKIALRILVLFTSEIQILHYSLALVISAGADL